MACVVIWAFSNFSHLNFFRHPIQYFKDSMMNSVLRCFPLTPSHVLDNWEKCMLTPLSWLVTLSGPGQHCGPSAPSSWTIWFESRDFQSWVMDQWSASDLAFSSFFFFFPWWSVCVCVWGVGLVGVEKAAEPDQHQQTKKLLLGINECGPSGSLLRWDWMFHDGLLVLKETISHSICCGHNIPLASPGAGMSLH